MDTLQAYMKALQDSGAAVTPLLVHAKEVPLPSAPTHRSLLAHRTHNLCSTSLLAHTAHILCSPSPSMCFAYLCAGERHCGAHGKCGLQATRVQAHQGA